MTTTQSSLKAEFKQWLEEKKREDEIIAIVTIPKILRRFDSKLVVIKGNRLEKRYLNKWRKLFRIDKKFC